MIEQLIAQSDPVTGLVALMIWREVRSVKSTVCNDVKPRIERLESEHIPDGGEPQ